MSRSTSYNNPPRGFVEISNQTRKSDPEESVKRQVKRPIILGYLFVVMGIIGYYAIVVLGAHHLQHEVRDITLKSQRPVSVARFIEYKTRKSKISATYDAAIQALDPAKVKGLSKDAGTTLSSVRDLYANIESQRSFAERQFMDNGLSELEAKFSNALIKANDQSCDLLKKLYAAENARHYSEKDLLIETGFGEEKPRPIIRDGAFINEGNYLGNFSYAYAKLLNHKDEKVENCELAELRKARFTLDVDDHILEPLAAYIFFDNSSEDSSALNGEDESAGALNGIWAWFGSVSDNLNKRTIQTPRQMLTVLLVMAMGALGGTVDLLRRHLDITRSVYIESMVFMPVLGMISGFAIFVLVKSGVLLIAEPNAGENGAILSPYFVAFLGLISGLLAKEAMDSILIVGRRIFQRSADEVARYYIGDTTKATDVDGVVEPVAHFANVSNRRVISYLNGNTPVPGPLQILIAHHTGQEHRKCFTDLAPLTSAKDEIADIPATELDQEIISPDDPDTVTSQ